MTFGGVASLANVCSVSVQGAGGDTCHTRCQKTKVNYSEGSVEPVCMCTGSQASDWQGWAHKGTPLQAAGGIEVAGMGSWALLDGQQHAACALQQR